MSSREKRLLIFMAVVVFLVVHVAAAKLYYLPKLKNTRGETKRLSEQVKQGEGILDSQDERIAEINWLAKYEPQPTTSQKAISSLEELANREALRRGLTVKRRIVLPSIDSFNLNFHRARVDLEVSGSEQVLYQWLHFLHSPPDLRGVTSLLVTPKSGDDTLIDCRVTVEQWYVPEES